MIKFETLKSAGHLSHFYQSDFSSSLKDEHTTTKNNDFEMPK